MLVFRHINASELVQLRPRRGEGFQDLEVQLSDTIVGVFHQAHGTMIAACGFFTLHEGCQSVWAVISDAARQGVALEFARKSRHLLSQQMDIYNLKRLQAFCNPTNREYSRFLKLMQFEYEGTLRKFTPDFQDVDLYARVE